MITTYIGSLLTAVDALRAEPVAPDLLQALLELERLLDQSRVIYANRVPMDERTIDIRDLHQRLDSLRSYIYDQLVLIPPSECESILRTRVLDAQSSWWHILNKKVSGGD